MMFGYQQNNHQTKPLGTFYKLLTIAVSYHYQQLSCYKLHSGINRAMFNASLFLC